jgi:hypothetical protein
MSMANKINSSSVLGGSAFLKIRHAALEKATKAIKEERFDLDRKLDKGHISKSQYKKDLMDLIIKGSKLKNEREEIEAKMNGI